MPRIRISPRKTSASNQCLSRWVAKASSRRSIFSLACSSATGTKTFGYGTTSGTGSCDDVKSDSTLAITKAVYTATLPDGTPDHAADLAATFNMGVGMVAVLPSHVVDEAVHLLAERGLRAWVCGSVMPAKAGNEKRVRLLGQHVAG